jgi:hypothetical protein
MMINIRRKNENPTHGVQVQAMRSQVDSKEKRDASGLSEVQECQME